MANIDVKERFSDDSKAECLQVANAMTARTEVYPVAAQDLPDAAEWRSNENAWRFKIQVGDIVSALLLMISIRLSSSSEGDGSTADSAQFLMSSISMMLGVCGVLDGLLLTQVLGPNHQSSTPWRILTVHWKICTYGGAYSLLVALGIYLVRENNTILWLTAGTGLLLSMVTPLNCVYYMLAWDIGENEVGSRSAV